MAFLNYSILVPIFCNIIPLLLVSYVPNILSQDPSNSSPTIAQCTSSLVPLIPCTPFVQGAARSPAPQCCDNIKQLYSQQSHCLCLLLNDTALSSVPINRTLAQQLPTLCNLQGEANISACSGEPVHAAPPPTVFFGTKNNSTAAASPASSMPPRPRPSIMGYGLERSQAINLKTTKTLVVIMTLAILFFTCLLN